MPLGDSFEPGASIYELKDVMLVEDLEERKEAFERWQKRWYMRLEVDYSIELTVERDAKKHGVDMREHVEQTIVQRMFEAMADQRRVFVTFQRLGRGLKHDQMRATAIFLRALPAEE